MHNLSRYCYLWRSSSHGKFIYFTASLSFSTTVNENPPSRTSFIYDYLINSYGFSPNLAMAASKQVTSLDRPQSVLKFLKQSGLDETHIKTLISWRPEFLNCKVDMSLKPKVEFLQDLGFSGSSLGELLAGNPKILLRHLDRRLKPSIDYLRSLLHTEENVFKAIKKSGLLLRVDLKRNVIPNIEILRRCGVSSSQLSMLVIRHARLIAQSPDWLEELVSRVNQAGIKCGSKMFVYGVCAFGKMSKATLMTKFDTFKSLGWSEEDITLAFNKAPFILLYSERVIQVKMEFFFNELGYKPSEIAVRPLLLGFSLEKRLIPRNKVLKILKFRGLLKKNNDFLTVARLSEKMFLKSYVLPYIDKASDLQQAYTGCEDAEVRKQKRVVQ